MNSINKWINIEEVSVLWPYYRDNARIDHLLLRIINSNI